jgi:hypothetical protein
MRRKRISRQEWRSNRSKEDKEKTKIKREGRTRKEREEHTWFGIVPHFR